MRKARRVGVLALAALLISATRDQQVEVPVELQLPLISSVLAFDRTLRDRPGEELLVLVIYQSGYRASRDVRDQIEERLEATAGVMIHGKSVRWEFLDLKDPSSLASELVGANAAVAYLAPMRALDLEALTAAAVQAQVISIACVPDYVRRGAVLGFELRGGRPNILINLKAARAAGVKFGAQLLQVAEIVAQ